jgi:hypothetical protein
LFPIKKIFKKLKKKKKKRVKKKKKNCFKERSFLSSSLVNFYTMAIEYFGEKMIFFLISKILEIFGTTK